MQSIFGIVPRRISIVFGFLALLSMPLSALAQAHLYVSNTDGGTVSAISSATNTVVSTITVGSEPRNLVVTPNGARVYVPNRFGDTVSVINTATQLVIDTVNDASFDEPYSAAVTPNGTEVWVVNKQGGGSNTGSVTIISTATNTVVGTVNHPCFSSPEWISINPVLPRAYVINPGNGTVCMVDTGTRAVVAPVITVGGEPRSAVALPDGSALFVARTNVAAVSGVARINTANNAVTGIAVNGSPRNMAITPSGNKVYVPTQGGDLAVIATASNTVSTVAIGAGSLYGAAVAQTPAGLRVYVTDESDEEVYVVNTATDTVVNGAGLPINSVGFNTPRAIAATPPPSAPAFDKLFGAASIPVGGTTSLSFTLTNNNQFSALTGIGFTDNLPAGLVVATPNGLSGSCGGGTITAVAGLGSVSLAGATLAAGASCNFSVNVTGMTAGAKNNITGPVSAIESGDGGTASDSISVVALAVVPPTIGKSFGTAVILLNGTTSLNFTLSNPNASALTGVGFNDTLPAGLVVATPNGLSGSCGGGTITAVAGSGSVSLTGATLAAGGSCNFSVNVTGTSIGGKNNTTGPVSSNEGGNGNAATANLSVVAAEPTLPTAIPTLQQWALWLLGLLIVVTAGFARRTGKRG